MNQKYENELMPVRGVSLRGTFDLEPFLDELSRQPPASWVASIAELVLNRPETHTAFGVKGFEPDDESDVW